MFAQAVDGAARRSTASAGSWRSSVAVVLAAAVLDA